MKTICQFIVSAFIVCFSFNSLGQTPPVEISNSLQAILDASLPSTYAESGAVLSVHVPGQWNWNSSAGYAISGNTAGQAQTMASPTTQFRVGSITKTMVAACILKLEEQGLLSIEDNIDLYLRSTLVNDTIMSSAPAKIRHLLNHTSGIANSADNLVCQQDVLANPGIGYSLEEAIYCGCSQGEIFAPGIIWAYSNTNYSILAMIIEEITGGSYQEFLAQTIIAPLNLSNTEIPSTNQITGDHMGCYWNIGTWIDLTVINPMTYAGWADVVSTTSDLNTFYQNLLEGNIVNPSSLAKMKIIDAASFDYGLGLDFYSISGDEYFGHSGEVANTSGMFYSELVSTETPVGYYISYNFNVQGVDIWQLIDKPVHALLKNATGTSGLDEDMTISNISVYPNPSSEMIKISGIESIEEVLIFNMLGEVVQQENTSSFSVQEMESGMYVIKVTSKNEVSSTRFTKK